MTDFVPITIAILTISDTRTAENDTSGRALLEHLTKAGHTLGERALVRDDRYVLRSIVSRWIADPKIQVVITTGGTGLTGRDSTPEAIKPLFDKEIEGFGELFRAISYEEIGTSTLQSRALAGLANGTVIFCLPGSTGACHTAWTKIIEPQLDRRHAPCNFIELLPRFQEPA
ncbi:MAG: molybdenum cofactor biosynthesis protein B [Acidiferrobacter sp.]